MILKAEGTATGRQVRVYCRIEGGGSRVGGRFLLGGRALPSSPMGGSRSKGTVTDIGIRRIVFAGNRYCTQVESVA
jgi:hypothetical protein